MDVVPQSDLKLSNTRWSRYSEGHLQTSSTAKKEECRQIFFLWLTPTALWRNWLLFLPGLTLLQSPRTKYSVAWLEIFRTITRRYHIWRNSTTLLKTSQSSDVRQEGPWVCTPQCNINGSTTLQLPHRLPSSSTKVRVNKKKVSTTMNNHDPRMNRISSIVLVELPPNTASIMRSWYLEYLLCLIW
jgi:hypothetical protein